MLRCMAFGYAQVTVCRDVRKRYVILYPKTASGIMTTAQCNILLPWTKEFGSSDNGSCGIRGQYGWNRSKLL